MGMDIREHLKEIRQLTASKPIRRFAYNELGEDNPVIVDEFYIREYYWPYWQEQMRLALERKSPNVTPADVTWDKCLDDFLVVNWAWEVGEDGRPLRFSGSQLGMGSR